MKTITFEDYLMQVHAKDYHGTDDDMSDNFEAWLERLDVETVMQYAELFAAELNNRILKLINLSGEAIAELQKIKEMVNS